MTELEIHGFAGSTYVRTARMVCVEKGARHRLVPLDFGADSHLALHPFLRMPVLVDGKRRLYETLAIACYIDRICGGPALQPSDPFENSEMFMWISACCDYVYNDVVKMMVKSENPTVDELTAAKRDLEVLDRALSGRTFLAGASLSLADLFLAPMIAYAAEAHAEKRLLEGLSSLRGWHEHMAMRPSFKESAQ